MAVWAHRTLSLAGIGLALSAATSTIATWRADLVAGRRRLRVFVLIGTAVYIGADTSLRFWPPPSASGYPIGNIANAFGLFVLVGASGWSLLRAAASQQGAGLLSTTGGGFGKPVSATSDPPEAARPVDSALLRRLDHLMAVERVHRREGLTIGTLSAELGVPEQRLRRLINDGLGHRNFNAFLNRYRIEEAKSALADPAQQEVPVLTIAMDAGFQSIGPFNRAFKADTDLTPTEFRRLVLAMKAAAPPIEARRQEIGKSN